MYRNSSGSILGALVDSVLTLKGFGESNGTGAAATVDFVDIPNACVSTQNVVQSVRMNIIDVALAFVNQNRQYVVGDVSQKLDQGMVSHMIDTGGVAIGARIQPLGYSLLQPFTTNAWMYIFFLLVAYAYVIFLVEKTNVFTDLLLMLSMNFEMPQEIRKVTSYLFLTALNYFAVFLSVLYASRTYTTTISRSLGPPVTSEVLWYATVVQRSVTVPYNLNEDWVLSVCNCLECTTDAIFVVTSGCRKIIEAVRSDITFTNDPRLVPRIPFSVYGRERYMGLINARIEEDFSTGIFSQLVDAHAASYAENLGGPYRSNAAPAVASYQNIYTELIGIYAGVFIFSTIGGSVILALRYMRKRIRDRRSAAAVVNVGHRRG